MERTSGNYEIVAIISKIGGCTFNATQKTSLLLDDIKRSFTNKFEETKDLLNLFKYKRLEHDLEEIGGIYYNKVLMAEMSKLGLRHGWITLFVNAGDSAMWLKDSDNIFIAINTKFSSNLPNPPHTIVGTTIKHAMKRNLNNVFLEKIMIQELMNDGRDLTIKCFNVSNDKGEIIALLGTDGDISQFEPLPENITLRK